MTLMLTAIIRLEVMSVHALLVILEMGSHVVSIQFRTSATAFMLRLLPNYC